MWNEKLSLKQSIGEMNDNSQLMHSITIQLRNRHTAQRVRSVDILYDGKIIARKLGEYNITSNVTFLDNGVEHTECIIFPIEIKDIDECALGIHKCVDPHMVCVNTPGSYKCVCKKGFVIDHECDEDYLDNDKCKATQTCLDINECITLNPCPENSECINTIGSYKCKCLNGFRDIDPISFFKYINYNS